MDTSRSRSSAPDGAATARTAPVPGLDRSDAGAEHQEASDHDLTHRVGAAEPGPTSAGARPPLPWRRRPRQEPRRRPGIAARVLLTVVAVAGAGMLVAGGVALWVQEQAVERRVDASLAQEVDELRALAATQAGGEPYTDVEALLDDALVQTVPDGDEGVMVLLDGTVPFVLQGERGIRPEEVPELRADVDAVDPTATIRLRTVEGTVAGELRELRYVAVPVTVPGDPRQGFFVTAVDLDSARAQVRDAADAYLITSIAALGLVALAGGAVASRLLRPVRLLSRTARRITEEDLSERIPVRGGDELSELTRTVNSMLERLDRAFAGQRQLLDDVGHELRTPLTVVRGHVELMDARDPADVEETRELALDELDRMHRLVDDLVLLARSGRPDFLHWGDVEVDAVVERTLERVRALGDRRWRLDARSGVVVRGDGQRLVQALMQLASNAVRHTGPEDEVALGAAVELDVVRLWVRDTGPGVTEADKQLIFERAAQGRHLGTSVGPAAHGAAGHDGSGLGLAIVSAIAEAHGGRVTLASTVGAGAVFAVEVPLGDAGAAEGGDDDGRGGRP
ncbi:sensor histidine kinase [Pseudokineococcus sp. 1T1Z-3]|uniref:sensor histidine kinase n=1 Tax=Pseudokineococcus sp. 1T1Z-3 TaxID=3132745 RepID=UPI0030952C2E